jgi:phosphoribosylanthranilate isomerase
MSLWIKICGLTTKEAVDAAVAAGADAVGFVFAPSKRNVSAQSAVELCVDVPDSIPRVAVMQHPDPGLVEEVWEVFQPDILQTDWTDLAALDLPNKLHVLPVVRAGTPLPTPLPTRMLFEGAVSGTGTVADWAQAAELARKTQLVLAGGLNPLNVAAAITTVAPFGVDVSSGVESEPGVKDIEKIRAFVSAARRAAQERIETAKR